MKYFTLVILIAILYSICGIGCHNVADKENIQKDTTSLFLQHFYSNCSYQKQHIQFPLKGEVHGYLDTLAYFTNPEYTWQANTWKCLKKGSPSTNFIDSILHVHDTLINIYGVRHTDQYNELYFVLKNGSWNLVSRKYVNL